MIHNSYLKTILYRQHGRFVRTRIRPNNEDATEIEVYRSENEKLQSKLDGLCEERDRLLERKRRVQKVHVDEFVCEDQINITDDENLF